MVGSGECIADAIDRSPGCTWASFGFFGIRALDGSWTSCCSGCGFFRFRFIDGSVARYRWRIHASFGPSRIWLKRGSRRRNVRYSGSVFTVSSRPILRALYISTRMVFATLCEEGGFTSIAQQTTLLAPRSLRIFIFGARLDWMQIRVPGLRVHVCAYAETSTATGRGSRCYRSARRRSTPCEAIDGRSYAECMLIEAVGRDRSCTVRRGKQHSVEGWKDSRVS